MIQWTGIKILLTIFSADECMKYFLEVKSQIKSQKVVDAIK